MSEKNANTRGNSGSLIGLISESHIHVGTGQSVDALDLPVARERVTQYPFIPGSGVKGAFNVWARERAQLNGKANFLFGKDTEKKGQTVEPDNGSDQSAGALLCSDARLLLLPVRSLASSYKWVTCPGILRRLARDLRRAGVSMSGSLECIVEKGQYLGVQVQGGNLSLEERDFSFSGVIKPDVFETLLKIIPYANMGKFLQDQMVVLNDDDFTWFARFALPVMSRNRLDENKLVVPGALWHEETLPPDTVLYLTFGERRSGAIQTVNEAVKRSPYIQLGGNVTIGQGWFAMACHGDVIETEVSA